ncbi:MAG: 5'-nucleotidase C-terminal domain-containing protein [Spirochaetales bacterium]|nr:5'-nucleotidase C-terminal domain-containing protein [Spirochaetales bacterium]
MKLNGKFLGVLTAVLLLAGCMSGPIKEKGVEHELVILHTNDHHGHPIAFYDYPASDQGGLPARSTYVKSVRAANSNVLVLDAGDFNTGRPESNFFKTEPDIIGYNMIGYDAVTMGNHEFDNNWEIMQQQIAMSDFPWLCANVKKDGEYINNVKPYIIKEYDGFKVAILGLMTRETESTGNPEYIKGLTFEDEVKVANELVPMLKKQADIVIALVHMGLYDNDMKGSRKIAANVPGVSLVIDGHSHTMINEPVMVNGVPIVQARHWGLYMGNGTLKFKDGEVTSFDWKLDPINVQYKDKDADGNSIFKYVSEEIAKDEAVLAELQPFADKVDDVLSEVIGNAADVFLNDNTRKMETAIGDIVTDSQEWFLEQMDMDIDFAFQNGGGIRATLGAGEIQKQTIYEILPFDNSIALVTLSGKDVIALFDKAATNIGAGAMAQVSSSVKVTFNAETKTVEELLIYGAPVDPAKDYNIAVNSYLASGGDGYDVFNNKTNYYDSSLMQRDAFIDYIIYLGGEITPITDGRITIK